MLAISVASFHFGPVTMWDWSASGIMLNLVYWPLVRPVNLLWLCLVFLALHRAFARRVDNKQPQSDLPRIDPARFVSVWFAALAFMISGALVLVWMSFALWFNPWWRGRWP
jgi:hypothetical protein